MKPVTFLLDSNVSHVLVDDVPFRRALRGAVDAGDIQLLVTHVQVDENLAQSDQEAGRQRVHAMMAAGVRAVETSGFVLDVSRLDHAKLFDEATAAMYEAFVQSNRRHAEDGLLAATALREKAIFVTSEKRARNRFMRHFAGLVLWTPEQLREYVEAEALDRETVAGQVASGSLTTPAFVGPGARSTSFQLQIRGLAEPALSVSLVAAVEPLAVTDDRRTAFSYRIADDGGGSVDVAITVRRDAPGEEARHAFEWRLWDRTEDRRDPRVVTA
jgi:hypothetical protein